MLSSALYIPVNVEKNSLIIKEKKIKLCKNDFYFSKEIYAKIIKNNNEKESVTEFQFYEKLYWDKCL